MAHSCLNTALCNFTECNTHGCIGAYPEDVRQMPRYSLSLSIRVGREVYYIGCLCVFLKLFYKSRLIFFVFVFRLKVIININSELRLRQGAYMTYRCYYGVILSEILFNCFRLCRRLNYYQMGQIFVFLSVPMRHPKFAFQTVCALLQFVYGERLRRPLLTFYFNYLSYCLCAVENLTLFRRA